MRRLLQCAVLAGAVCSLAACSSVGGQDATGSALTLVPSDTSPAPGSCDPNEEIPAPTIKTGSQNVIATLGIGSFDCAALNGDGYIAFAYNPVLIDTDSAIEVDVGNATATLQWDGGQPFTETSPGTWKTSAPPSGCNRLTINLQSAGGKSTATYGADIRVGGENVACPQRVIDPTDPGATDTVVIGSIPQFSDPGVIVTTTPTTAPNRNDGGPKPTTTTTPSTSPGATLP